MPASAEIEIGVIFWLGLGMVSVLFGVPLTTNHDPIVSGVGMAITAIGAFLSVLSIIAALISILSTYQAVIGG